MESIERHATWRRKSRTAHTTGYMRRAMGQGKATTQSDNEKTGHNYTND